MAPTTTTVRPLQPTSYFADYFGWAITGGSANVPAALNDNSDLTYITSPYYGIGSRAIIPMAGFTLPAGEHPSTITPRIRVRRPTGLPAGVIMSVRVQPDQLAAAYGNGGAASPIINRLTGAAAGQELFNLYPTRTIAVAANAGAAAFTTYTLPTTTVTDTLVKYWQVEVWFNAAGRTAGIAEVYLDVVSVPLGTISYTLPTSPVTDTTRPIIQSQTTDPEGEGTRMYRVLYESSVYGAPGFDPWLDQDQAVPGWTDTTNAQQYSGTTDLAQGATYRVYGWPYFGLGCKAAVTQQFTMTLSQPAAPTVTPVYDTVNARTVITVNGHANVLTRQQASMEDLGTTGFTVGTNCTLARTTAQAKSGAASLQVTATAAATFNVRVTPTATFTDYVPVTAGQSYTFTAAVRSAVTARGVTLGLAWYDGAGALLSTTTSASTNDAAGSWTVMSLVATAATGALYVVPIITWATAAASEVHYLDELALYPGVTASSVNLLGDDLSTFESGVDLWNNAFSSSVLSVSAVRAFHGTKSVLCTWGNGTGSNLAACMLSGLTPGQTYTASMYVYVVSGAACAIENTFGGPTFVGTPAGTTAVTSGTGSWQRLGITFIATATSHLLGINPGAGNLTGQSAHLDAVQLELGTAATAFGVPSAAWSVGGTTAYEVVVERSKDAGGTWETVRPNVTDTIGPFGGTVVGASTQTAIVYDYEAPRGVPLLYRAVERATYATLTLPSSLSTNAAVTTVNDGSWWIKAPLAPTLNAGGPGVLRVQKGSLSFELTEDVGTFRPLGRRLAVVVSGDLGGEDGSLQLTTLGAAEWAKVYALLTHQEAWLLQDPDGSQKYVRINDDRSWKRDAGAVARRSITVQYVEVDSP